MWPDWAYELATALAREWVWLKGQRIARVAATLATRLGPDWLGPLGTATPVVDWVTRSRAGRPLLAAPAAPLAYLRKLLDDALTCGAVPPARAAGYDAYRRRVELGHHGVDRARHDALAADFDAHAAAGVALADSRAQADAAALAARLAATKDRDADAAADLRAVWDEVPTWDPRLVPSADEVARMALGG